VRIEDQAEDVLAPPALLGVERPLGAAPGDPASERALELVDGVARHRVHHLLVEARVGLGRRDTAVDQDVRVVEIDRPVVLVARGVVVDDGDAVVRALALRRAGHEVAVAHVELHLVAEQPAAARVESEDAERPPRRRHRIGLDGHGPSQADLL